MDADIRSLGEDEYQAFFAATATSFGERLSAGAAERERTIMVPGRSLGAIEAGEIVAGLTSVPFPLTVPGGGFVECAGVTSVATLPTHRRRGLARALLRAQLEDVHERGEPLAYLWASEASIYQRFGYGAGAFAAAFEIDRRRTGFLEDRAVPGRIRLVEKDEALKLLPEVYERERRVRPGMPGRTQGWWEYGIHELEEDDAKDHRVFFAVYESADGVEGYALYWIEQSWSHRGGPAAVLQLHEMVTTTDDAYAALWRYLLDMDLVQTVKGWKRPVDEPLLVMLREPRALGMQIRDGTWLRLVDVAAALEARRYERAGTTVLEVRDDVSPWNQGTYELEGAPEEAACRRTDAQPELRLDVNALASAYLGAVSFRSLQHAGRVEERTAGAVERADAMFAAAVAPWCPWLF